MRLLMFTKGLNVDKNEKGERTELDSPRILRGFRKREEICKGYWEGVTSECGVQKV